jgi:hypothetical protein
MTASVRPALAVGIIFDAALMDLAPRLKVGDEVNITVD